MKISRRSVFLIFMYIVSFGLISFFEINYINSNKKIINENKSNFKNYVLLKNKETTKNNFMKQKEKNIDTYKKLKQEEIRKAKELEEKRKKEEEERKRKEEEKRIKEEEEKRKKEEEKQKKEEEQRQIEIQKEIDNFSFVGDVVLEGDISYSVKKEMNEKMKLIPQNLLNTFYNNGYQLVLTTKSIQGNYYNGSVSGPIAGLFMGDRNTIYVAAIERYIDMALLHEFGHFLDSLHGYVSTTDEFVQIFYEEKEYLTTFSYDNHYKSNTKEYFAESFEQIIENPERCRNEVPKTYEFITRYMNNF